MSGLATVDGGVLVFGLETNKSGKGDPNRLSPEPVVQTSAHLENAGAFKRAVQRYFRDVTTPTVPGVMVETIAKPSAQAQGLVVLLVPLSDARPHRVAGHLGKEIAHRYYMRTDTDTVPMPHEMLAALFGRVPPPKLTLSAKWNGANQTPSVNFYLHNRGRGTAREPIVRLDRCEADQLIEPILPRNMNRTPGGNFTVLELYEFKIMFPGFAENLGAWTVRRPYQGRANTVRLAGTIFAPDAQPVDFDEIVEFDHNLIVEIPR
jgi:hypothetical protein